MLRQKAEVATAEERDKDERALFLERYSSVFEHSPWVAEQAFSSMQKSGINWKGLEPEELLQWFEGAIHSASKQRQLNLLRAHPELACAPASRETLTDHSKSEQSLAGLDQCTTDEFAEFGKLNRAYISRFGFPFILAVRGYHRREILVVFRDRIDRPPDEEFETALEQVCRIGMLRLETDR